MSILRVFPNPCPSRNRGPLKPRCYHSMGVECRFGQAIVTYQEKMSATGTLNPGSTSPPSRVSAVVSVLAVWSGKWTVTI